MRKLWLALLCVSIVLFAVSAWAELTMAPSPNLARRTTEAWVSPNKGDGDATLGQEWIGYFNGSGYWIWWGGPERATMFDPTTFPNGVYPFYVKKVRSLFYELPQRPWGACSTFTYKIYGDDGSTVLLESAVLVPSDRTGSVPMQWDLGADSIEVQFGNFWVSVAPVSDSHPSSYTDALWQGYTFVGSPGSWSPFSAAGEISIEAYVNWGSLSHDVLVLSITKPGFGAWVDSTVLCRANVKNNGGAAEDFDVEFLITTSPDTEYIDTVNVPALGAGATKQLNFASWIPALYDHQYTVTCKTLLGTDQNPNNDALTMNTHTYEYGEIAYDDFEQDGWWVVGSPNGPQDVFGQKLVPYMTPPFWVTKFKIYVNGAAPFDNVRLCPDNLGKPNFSSPYATISAPAASNPPEWIVEDFDTTATRIAASSPIWLCAQFANGGDGPGIGSDQDAPFDLKSYWTTDLSTWNVFGEDWFMRVVHIPTSIGVAEGATRMTASTRLHQNAPNPFRGMTAIKYSVSLPVDGSLRVYDSGGRLVRTLEAGTMDPGFHSVSWDGRDERGMDVGAGVYFYKLTTPTNELSKKMVLMR